MPSNTAQVMYYTPTSNGYDAILRTAFPFFRVQSSRRYSDSTLMSLSRAVDDITVGNRNDHLPHIIAIAEPVSFDDLTEVKHGGVFAMLVMWPNNGNRVILAVAQECRRQGWGRRLVIEAGERLGAIYTWVGNRNRVGHQFAIGIGMLPNAMNGQGAVRYNNGVDMMEEG